MPPAEPVGAPLPHVARTVVEPETVGFVLIHRGGAHVAVLGSVVAGKFPLPDVQSGIPVGAHLVTPRKPGLYQSAPGPVLPLGFRGQSGLIPGSAGGGVEPRHMHHRVVAPILYRRVRSLGARPTRSFHLAPPLGAHHPSGGLKVIRQQPAEHERPPLPLGEGHMPSGLHKGRELVVGHRGGRDLVRAQHYLPHRSLAVALEPHLLGAHEKRPAIQ